MIASLSGTARQVGLDRAVIDVGGVGFLVLATPGTLAALRPGLPCQVAISMVVREDALTLFAFADDDERAVFDTVRAVSGIGPKTALSLLAVHSPDDLRRAVHAQDVKAIQRVPGIGPKMAQRVLLELGDKLAPPPPSAQASGADATPHASSDLREQVVAALVSLGYQAKAATATVAEVLANLEVTTVTAADVPTILRAALRVFGGKHG